MLLKDIIMNTFDYLIAQNNFNKKIEKINYVCSNIVYSNNKLKIIIYVEEHENYFKVEVYDSNNVKVKDLYKYSNIDESLFNANIKNLYFKSQKIFGRKYLFNIIEEYKNLINNYIKIYLQ